MKTETFRVSFRDWIAGRTLGFCVFAGVRTSFVCRDARQVCAACVAAPADTKACISAVFRPRAVPRDLQLQRLAKIPNLFGLVTSRPFVTSKVCRPATILVVCTTARASM